MLRGTHTPGFAHSALMRAEDFFSLSFVVGGPLPRGHVWRVCIPLWDEGPEKNGTGGFAKPRRTFINLGCSPHHLIQFTASAKRVFSAFVYAHCSSSIPTRSLQTSGLTLRQTSVSSRHRYANSTTLFRSNAHGNAAALKGDEAVIQPLVD